MDVLGGHLVHEGEVRHDDVHHLDRDVHARRPGVRLGNAEQVPGVTMNDLTDPSVLDGLSGNAVLNGVPVTVDPVVALAP